MSRLILSATALQLGTHALESLGRVILPTGLRPLVPPPAWSTIYCYKKVLAPVLQYETAVYGRAGQEDPSPDKSLTVQLGFVRITSSLGCCDDSRPPVRGCDCVNL